MSIDWDKYPNFSAEEFECSHTGENKMTHEFMYLLQQIRKTFNKPMVISSGYRSIQHPIEKAKNAPGEHTYGTAADILVSNVDCMDLFVIAYGYGIRRIGLSQKGRHAGRFIHLGIGDQHLGFTKSIWTY